MDFMENKLEKNSFPPNSQRGFSDSLRKAKALDHRFAKKLTPLLKLRISVFITQVTQHLIPLCPPSQRSLSEIC
jgi:hypothetical protein